MNLFVAKWIKRPPGVLWVTGWNPVEESWHVVYRIFHSVSGFRIMDDVILSVINVSNLLLFLTGFLRGSKRAMMSVIQVYGWRCLMFLNADLKTPYTLRDRLHLRKLRPRPHLSVFVWRRRFLLWLNLPSTRIRWKRSLKTHLFKNALQSVEF